MYIFTQEDGNNIIEILNDKKMEDTETIVNEIGEDLRVVVNHYMAIRGIFESAMIAIIEEYERNKDESKIDAISNIGIAIYDIADVAAKLSIEVMLDSELNDFENVIGHDHENEDEGISVKDLPKEMVEELEAVTGLSFDEMCERGLFVKLASIDKNDNMEILSNSESKSLIKQMSNGDISRSYVGVDRHNDLENDKNKKSLDEIISDFDDVRKNL